MVKYHRRPVNSCFFITIQFPLSFIEQQLTEAKHDGMFEGSLYKQKANIRHVT